VTRIRLAFVQEFFARGKVYYYFRKPGCARIRLPGLPGSTEFMTAYQAALDAAAYRARSASRARLMSVSTACTFSGDTSPRLTSAAAMEPGVG
jgi:hypothetical protein